MAIEYTRKDLRARGFTSTEIAKLKSKGYTETGKPGRPARTYERETVLTFERRRADRAARAAG